MAAAVLTDMISPFRCDQSCQQSFAFIDRIMLQGRSAISRENQPTRQLQRSFWLDLCFRNYVKRQNCSVKQPPMADSDGRTNLSSLCLKRSTCLYHLSKSFRALKNGATLHKMTDLKTHFTVESHSHILLFVHLTLL